MEITIGCDPELFVKNQKGAYVSAHELCPGTKDTPFKVDKGAVQVDGTALEFNTDPARTSEEFVENVMTVMKELRNIVDQRYTFAIEPSVKFHGNHFRTLPDKVKELGCEPDYCAYTLKENPKPFTDTPVRTASGHVHVGFCEGADPNSEEHMVKCATLVKQLDCYLGLPSRLWDGDVRRQSLYGKPGAFRPKPYGLEYRVLSNSWLRSPVLMKFVFENTVKAVNDLIEGKRPNNDIKRERLAKYLSNPYYRDKYALRGIRDLLELHQIADKETVSLLSRFYQLWED